MTVTFFVDSTKYFAARSNQLDRFPGNRGISGGRRSKGKGEEKREDRPDWRGGALAGAAPSSGVRLIRSLNGQGDLDSLRRERIRKRNAIALSNFTVKSKLLLPIRLHQKHIDRLSK
ncbi:hypothetical protein [Rhodospirillum rubrum]|uniref:hypothetical protein n=1 Tax=Rhodospirillum rubrum TaxID=1085 RepID=UPI00190436AE|nr:hypothetical protein [Rhodospirillum rubrum]